MRHRILDRQNHILREELLKRIADKDALICLLTEKVDEALLSRAPKLRIAATVSVGYDNLDISACTHHKVAATNTPGVLDDTTADTAWMIMMAVARRLSEAESWLRSGTWPGWDLDQLCGADIWGKALGIVSFGRIGRRNGPTRQRLPHAHPLSRCGASRLGDRIETSGRIRELRSNSDGIRFYYFCTCR